MKLQAAAVAILFVTTVILGTVYLVGQQMLRDSANDPQIQMAQDAANLLSLGSSPGAVLTLAPINLANSQAPFLIIYSSNKAVIGSTATLQNTSPIPPVGVFDYAKSHTENRLTWQPQTGVRIAMVMRYYTHGSESGYVLAGRSLAETENRENQLGMIVLMGWIFSMVGTGLVFWVTERRPLSV